MATGRLELCNRIRMEAEDIERTGFPLEVLPQAVQSVILDMATYENYKIEFIATAMLSAVSAALGGAYRIRIKGDWQSSGALYVILVGRPGLGKTPPLEAAYRPIRKRDYALFKVYETEMEAWKAAGENGKKPVLKRTVVSDFTPESLLLTHHNNPRSVVILVDEIMGMFNSANRYTNGQLIEQLLTAWSGGALDVTRVNSPVPVHIEHPCINIIGTTQTKRVHELLKKGFEENGLLDRILFVMPKSPKLSSWKNRDEDGERTSLAAVRWENILNKVLALDYDTEAEEKIPHVLSMDREAREYFFSWWNRKVEGFCWNNVLTTYMKCKKKEKTVQSAESMSFFSCTEQTPEYYLISIMNSRFAAFYVDNLVNSTSHCTTGDAKLITIMTPTIEQLYECKRLFDRAFELKRSVAKGIATDLDIAEELNAVERANDLIVESIYQL